MKAGWRTTEFWLTLAAVALGGGVALGVVTPDQQGITLTGIGAIVESAKEAIGAAAAVAAAWGYTRGRSEVKSAEAAKSGGDGS